MPAERSCSGDSEHTPATATTGRSGAAAAAARATPAGALPCRVCSSSAPSPVTTRRAPDSRPVNASRSSSSSMPGCTAAPRKPSAGLIPLDEAERPLGHVRPACEALLQDRYILRRGALLRRIDRGGAARPEQRVIHVGGRDDLGTGAG